MINSINPQRILVRGVNWLGDAVMTTPALMRLRDRFPEAHIALLTRDHLADLWSAHRAIDQVISFPRGETVFARARNLKKEGFDTAVLFPNSTRAALEAWFSGIPTRVGYRGGARTWMLTHPVTRRMDVVEMRKRKVSKIRALVNKNETIKRPAIPIESHHLFHYLRLVASMGASDQPTRPQLFVTNGELESVAHEFGLPRHEGFPLVGLNAGAEYGPAKRWPVSHFIEAATALRRNHNCHFVIFGSPADFTLANELAEGLTRQSNPDGTSASIIFYNLAGKTNLRQLCAALKICDLLISNDTGPAHLAAAVGTRVVIPFGSTSAELTAPGLPGDDQHAFLKPSTPCSPCFLKHCPIDHRCMTEITVDRVVLAASRMLSAQ